MSDLEREDFYVIEEQSRESIRQLLWPLTDEELEAVAALFAHHNLKHIPPPYWALSARVRAHVSVEKKRRAKEAATSE
jgi:hypothetical protein